MPSSITTMQFLEEGSNMGIVKVPQTSYFCASSLIGILGNCRTKHWVSISTPVARRLDLEVLLSCWWLQTHIIWRKFSSTKDDDQFYALAQRTVPTWWVTLCHRPSLSIASLAPTHPHMTSQCIAKLALFIVIMSSHDDDDPTSMLLLLLLSLLPLPLDSQHGFWPPFSMTKKKMWPNFPMFSHNRKGWNLVVVEFELLMPHKWGDGIGWPNG